MNTFFAFIIALFTPLHAQTIQPTGGGGSTTIASGTSITGTNAGQLLYSSGSAIGGTNEFLLGNAGAALDTNGTAAGASFYVKNSTTLWNGGALGWSSGSDPTQAQDTGLSRESAGLIDIGTGSAASVAGTIKGRGIISASTVPATAGSCVIGSLVGGSTAGTFTATNACGAPATAVTAVVLLLPVNAPTGWACDAQSRTASSAVAVVQVASTVSAVSFRTIVATNDVVQWKCIGY